MDKSEKLLLNRILQFLSEIIYYRFLRASCGTSKRFVGVSPRIPMGLGQDTCNYWSSDGRLQTQTMHRVINSDFVLTLAFCT